MINTLHLAWPVLLSNLTKESQSQTHQQFSEATIGGEEKCICSIKFRESIYIIYYCLILID